MRPQDSAFDAAMHMQAVRGGTVSEDVVERAKTWIDDVTPMPLSVHFYAADEILEMVAGLVAEVEKLRRVVDALKVVIEHVDDEGMVPMAYILGAQTALAEVQS